MRSPLGRLSATIAALVVSCTCAFANEVIVYTYDELGRLVGVATTGTVNAGQTVSANFDPAGNRTNYTVNGIAVPILTVTNSFNGNEAGGNGLLTVTRSLVSPSATTVNLAYGGTATGGGVDYTGPASVTIPAGQTSATVALTIVNDNIVEGNETVTVTLGTVTAGAATVGSPSSATNTIADNDAATVSIANATNAAEPGMAGTLTLTQTSQSATATIVNLGYSGTATLGADYSGPGSVTIPAGSINATVTLAVIDDTLVEGNETAVVAISIGSGQASLGAPSSATNTIADNDLTSTLAIGAASAAEGGALSFTITRSGSTTGTSSVSFSTSNGTAAAGSDYAAGSGTVTFAANQTTATIVITTLTDALVEASESMTVTISAPVGATITNAVGAGSILDNTSTIGLGFAAANEGGVLTFYVGRTGGTSGSASVTYATSNLTAIAGSDYTAKTGTLVFGPGQTSATVTINALADTVTPEAAETFRVTLSNPSPGTSVTNLKGKGTINAN